MAAVNEERGFGLALAVALVLMLVAEAAGNKGQGHHGKPTPSPSPSPSPTSTPTPAPSPTPTPVPTPTPIISVTLAWDAVPDPTVEGYHLWSGSAPGAENMLAAVVLAGNALTATVPVLTGTTYFTVTAYNTVADSPPSNEVSFTTP